MIRLALVGCSNVSLYERLARRLPSADIVAIVDPDSSGSLREAELESCDAVIIESSAAQRADLTVQAAEARKHVLVTPPFAPTIEDADRVIESCRTVGVCLMVGQRKRFLPAVATIKQSLADGKLGALGLVRLHRWEPRASAGAALEDVSSEPVIEDVGEKVIELAIEEFDVARWFFGASPTIIHATGCEIGEGRYLQVHFGFSAGGMALIDCAPTLPGARGYFSLSAIGSSGAAYADDHHNTHLLLRDGDPTALISDQESESLGGLIEEFLRAISEDRAPAITGADGRDLLEISTAVQRSISCGCSVARQGGSYEPTE